ncbi:MAG: efflux RND transporter periplasmic adaptor subunit [Bryobacterales bacterium]
MTNNRGILYLIVGILLGVGSCALLVWNPLGWARVDHALGRHSESDHAPAAAGNTLYTCGMHPQVIQDKPGNCPICGMKLVPMQGSGQAATAPDSENQERKILYWRAPMDPSYTSDKPGKSPMGMDLVPVYEDEASSAGGVRVSASFLQNFAVRTTPVAEGPLALEVRAVGILAHNEKSVVSVNTKFEGWIEKARVNNVGEHVAKGDVLFEIYSPALVTTQQEFLASRDYVRRLEEKGAYSEAIERARSLVEAARERLRYWDVSEQQIDALEQTGKVHRTVEFASPASGFIVEKMGNSLEGMKISPGMTVLKLADHSSLWAEVEFYEDDIRHMREGQRVAVEVDAFPGRRWSGKIVLFRPALNPATRTLTALVEIANPGMRLRPQMYANVIAHPGGAARALLVPAQAVLHSGERAVVIVAKGGGLFEPREVQLGLEADGMQQILAGVTQGEEVVTSSQFLIDSESNLRAAIDMLLGNRKPDGIDHPQDSQH